MGAYHAIPQNSLDICEKFIERVYDKPTAELFCDAVHTNDRGRAIAILEELLSTRDMQGFPTGPKGLPSERLIAKRVATILEQQGPDFPSR